MRSDIYTILALAARYWFCGIALVIVFRAWRITVIDNRRAKILRSWAPENSSIGEFILLPTARNKKPLHFFIPREGVLGSGSRTDICIRHADIIKKHLFFEQHTNGLLVRPLRGAQITLDGQQTGEQVVLRDGDILTLGKMRLMLVLFDSTGQSAHEIPLFNEPTPVTSPKAIDDFFDEDDIWPEETDKKKKNRKK